MVKAMAKKTVFEGPTSMQQAAFERSIIQCSGVFATSSKNGKTIKVWEMSVVDNKTNDDSTTNNDLAKVCLVQELQHDAVIEAVDAAEDGCSIIVGDVMGDVFFWSKSKSYLSAFGVTKSKRWTLIHKFTWRDDIRVHTGEIFQRSITSLCFLDGTKKFVSGTKEGMVQIWNGNTSGKSQTVRVAEQPVSCIQKLSMNDPNVEGFSVCCDGGRVVALTVKFEGEDVIELDAFPVRTCNKEDGQSSVITTMKAIAAPCNVSRTASLIVGDDNGTIHLSHMELN
jgi:WD40 repeat protein